VHKWFEHEHNIKIYPYAHNSALIYAHKFMCINLFLPTMPLDRNWSQTSKVKTKLMSVLMRVYYGRTGRLPRDGYADRLAHKSATSASHSTGAPL
jgi:hypothetical protein